MKAVRDKVKVLPFAKTESSRSYYHETPDVYCASFYLEVFSPESANLALFTRTSICNEVKWLAVHCTVHAENTQPLT